MSFLSMNAIQTIQTVSGMVVTAVVLLRVANIGMGGMMPWNTFLSVVKVITHIGEKIAMKSELTSNAFTKSDLATWCEQIIEKYQEAKEQEIFQNLQDTKRIEEAVLIMNPIHKELVSKSELSKATILWSNLCPEDKAFMVTDDELKERMKQSITRTDVN